MILIKTSHQSQNFLLIIHPFSVVHDVDLSTKQLNDDLSKMHCVIVMNLNPMGFHQIFFS